MTALCSIARETGDVPLSCLFNCPRDCRQRVYTGVGSRETPPDVCAQMTALAARLSAFGYTMRSGGAEGADTAFEQGAEHPEVYLPWRGYNSRRGTALADMTLAQRNEAIEVVAAVHPAWGRLTPAVRLLHIRNVFQVLGRDLASPSRFLVCWTPDGAEAEDETSAATGGTRTAIVIAARHRVPVFNLRRPGAHERFAAAWSERGWA